MFNVSVELTTFGTLACDLTVTLMLTPGTATGEKHKMSLSDELTAALSFKQHVRTHPFYSLCHHRC